MYMLPHTSISWTPDAGGVRESVDNHRSDHLIGRLDSRNSDAKENKTNLRGFTKQEDLTPKGGYPR